MSIQIYCLFLIEFFVFVFAIELSFLYKLVIKIRHFRYYSNSTLISPLRCVCFSCCCLYVCFFNDFPGFQFPWCMATDVFVQLILPSFLFFNLATLGVTLCLSWLCDQSMIWAVVLEHIDSIRFPPFAERLSLRNTFKIQPVLKYTLTSPFCWAQIGFPCMYVYLSSLSGGY